MNTTQDDMNRPADPAGRRTGPGDAAHPGEEATRLARQVKEESKARVDEYRGTAADKVDRLAQGVKAAASELDDGDLGQLSRHINDLAGGMTRLSQGLREKSADELIRDVNRLARDNPTLFVVGGVALGFALTRLLRASTQASDGGDGDDDRNANMDPMDWSRDAASRDAGAAIGGTGGSMAGAGAAGSGMEPGPGAGSADPFAGGSVPGTTSPHTDDGSGGTGNLASGSPGGAGQAASPRDDDESWRTP